MVICIGITSSLCCLKSSRTSPSNANDLFRDFLPLPSPCGNTHATQGVETLTPHLVWKYGGMSGRPTKFEHSQYLGDKRTQVVYDLDDPRTPADLIDELVASGKGATFGPDSLVEAANRNYKPFKIKN